jgi:hypothetical protein
MLNAHAIAPQIPLKNHHSFDVLFVTFKSSFSVLFISFCNSLNLLLHILVSSSSLFKFFNLEFNHHIVFVVFSDSVFISFNHFFQELPSSFSIVSQAF